VLLGVLTITAATLFLQIALTKFFSFRLWYHYAFMIISITMLGLSAASAVLALFEHRLLKLPTARILHLGAALFGASTLAALGALTAQGDLLFPLGGGDWIEFVAVAGCWLALFPPFFFSGVVVSWAIQRHSSQISRLYATDLAGAGLGCLLAVLGLSSLFTEQCIALAAGLAFIAAVVFGPGFARTSGWWAPSAAGLVLCAGVGMLGPQTWGSQITLSKGLAGDLARGGKIVASAPGMNGRVDVVDGVLARFAWGLSHLYQGSFPPQLAIRIDGDALTTITRLDPESSWEFTDYMPASLPYLVANPRSVLIIGVGGGMDVANAVNRGAARVVGVEINRQIIDLLDQRFLEWSGGIYRHPAVEIVHSDGRTYVERSSEKFDVIQLTLVDTFAAISSGALALAEDFLYTTEAFEAYIDHLAPDGILVLGRTREESLSLLSLIDAATRDRGLRLEEHVFIARARALHGLVLLFKRSPFTPEEIAKALVFVERNGMELVYAPGQMEEALPEVNAFLTSSDRAALASQLGRDLAPESDDAPFYFRHSKWSQLLGTYTGGQGNLLLILAVSLLFGIVAIVLPLTRVAPGVAWKSASTLSYFGMIGLGYIIVEMVLLVQFTFFLGHPTRSLTVTLFSLLLFSGVGALLSSGANAETGRNRLVAPLLGVAFLAAAYGLILPSLLSSTMGLPLLSRVLVAAALIAPLGVMMGMPLPLGVMLLRQRSPELVLWAWGINGFCSVLGSILAIIFAHAIGYRATLFVGAAMYLAALLALRRSTRMRLEVGGRRLGVRE